MLDNFFTVIQQIYGPYFLLVFAGCSIITIWWARLWLHQDGSMSYEPPKVEEMGPITLAVLRGGWAAATRTTIFNLWRRNLVKIETSGNTSSLKREEITPDQQKSLKEIERAVLFRIPSGGTPPATLLKDAGFQERIQSCIAPVEEKLEAWHLRRSLADRTRAWLITLTTLALIGSLGGSKLYLGISRNKPVLFLIIFMVVAIIALFVKLNPAARLTTLGQKVLADAEQELEWLKTELATHQPDESPSMPVLLAKGVAIYGVAFLMSDLLYSPFYSAFPKNKEVSGGCGGGGCGAGCSGGGCSGGCSGGCGGGCGGCGG